MDGRRDTEKQTGDTIPANTMLYYFTNGHVIPMCHMQYTPPPTPTPAAPLRTCYKAPHIEVESMKKTGIVKNVCLKKWSPHRKKGKNEQTVKYALTHTNKQTERNKTEPDDVDDD